MAQRAAGYASTPSTLQRGGRIGDYRVRRIREPRKRTLPARAALLLRRLLRPR